MFSLHVKTETVKVPKCHDNIVHTLVQTFSLGRTVEILKMSSHDMNVLKLLRSDDVYGVGYYGSLDDKIKLLQGLSGSYEDRFYETAPDADCPEMLIINKIKELSELINNYEGL